MTHRELAHDVAARLGIPREDARNLLYYVICTMFEGLVTDGEVEITGFGKLFVGPHPPRRAHHIGTGQMFHTRDSIAIRFRASPRLLEELRRDDDDEEI